MSNETDIPKTPNINVCIECKTKLNDSTPKPVSNCPLCGRPMCEQHLRAKLAQVPDFKSSGKKHRATMEILEKDCGSGDGHPCLPYTTNFWQQYEKQFEYRIPKTKTHYIQIDMPEEGDLIEEIKQDKAEWKQATAQMTEKQSFIDEEPPEIEYGYPPPERRSKNSKNKSQKKFVVITLIAIITLGFLLWLIISQAPPTISIISPKTAIYNSTSVYLTYTIDKSTSWVGYSLNNTKKVTLTGNTTLNGLSPGQYNLIIYANNTWGNMGSSNVSFTISRTFTSVSELINYLRDDDLSDAVWTPNYTCDAFAKDFIQRAEVKGYYCFTYYALWGWEDELGKYIDAVESIKVVKVLPYGTETRWYSILDIGLGHAVVKTTINSTELIIDPQTDVVLNAKDFTVLYEGEITK